MGETWVISSSHQPPAKEIAKTQCLQRIRKFPFLSSIRSFWGLSWLGFPFRNEGIPSLAFWMCFIVSDRRFWDLPTWIQTYLESRSELKGFFFFSPFFCFVLFYRSRFRFGVFSSFLKIENKEKDTRFAGSFLSLSFSPSFSLVR